MKSNSLSHAQTMPICNVSSQDAFYCSSVKVDENLTWELCFLKCTYGILIMDLLTLSSRLFSVHHSARLLISS